ncbi:MAG: hypothetical protein HFH85_15425 [Lachnospiraceae bacterium]|jgi:leader peptidase (prepilin peptidase)/N-methyltransferase|nr:hypothetical protein [Lachnospiraceae bacterium]
MDIILLTAVWLIIISIADIKRRRVPIWLLVPGGILTLAGAAGQQYGGSDIVRAVLPGVILLFLTMTTRSVGYGDGIVTLFLGFIMGGGKSLIMFGISLFLAAMCSLLLLAMRKVKKHTGIPFLPFLTAAWFVTAVF